MADFDGTAGDDIIDGTESDDDFDLDDGGDDRANGLGGNDEFRFGDELTRRDRIDGGTGSDTVTLSGNYSAGLVFAADSLISVEKLYLSLNGDYSITLDDGNVAAGEILTIDGSDLTASSVLFIDASAETDGELIIRGGEGDDVLIGGRLAITAFDLFEGGADDVTGGDNDDEFDFYATLDSTDRVRGGPGTDYLSILGDYAGGLTITSSMVRGVETFSMSGSHDYDMTIARGVVETGTHVTVIAGGVQPGHSVTVDLRAVDGTSFFIDTDERDTFIGNKGADELWLTGGGDHADGRNGDDSFEFHEVQGGHMTRRDRLDGGDGSDTLILNGDYSTLLQFKSTSIRNVETIQVASIDTYRLTTHDGNVAAGATLTVEALNIGVLIFDGAAETNGSFDIHGGTGDDVLSGGQLGDIITGDDANDQLFGRGGDDILIGGFGYDEMSGAAGADTYRFFTASGSTGAICDLFVTFNANGDFIDLPFAVSGLNAQANTGALSVETFDADMEAKFPNLGSHRAVVFAPDSGNLAGRIFLIVEDGGPNGYQAGEDYVFDVTNAVGLNTLAVDNFI